MVNELLATVSLDDVYIPVDTPNYFDRTTAGINYPYIFPQGKLIPTRIPTVNMASFSGLNGGPYPSHSAGPIYNISESFTWVKGSHTLKFGFTYEKSGENDNDEINVSACPTCTNNQNGQFSFTDARSGLPTSGAAVANVALGLFDTYSELGQRAYTVFRGNMYEAFAGDSWKVSQKLHVDYGVRYTVNVPYHALWGNMAAFDPKYYDPTKAVQIDPKKGLVIAGIGRPLQRSRDSGYRFPVFRQGTLPRSLRLLPQLPVPRRPNRSPISSGTTSSRASVSPTRSTIRPSSAPASAASSPAWASATRSSSAATRRSSRPPTSPAAASTIRAAPPPMRRR